MSGELSYDRKYFFDNVRASLFRGTLSQSQVEGMGYILDLWEKHFPFKPKTHLAYILASAYHETDQKMRPIEEYGKGAKYSYGKPAGPYNQCYYGRGHIQLTWEDNYKKGTQKIKPYGLTHDLHKNPEKALDDETSVIIMFDGMGDGWFTGVGLPKYFNSTTEDPKNARRIVNGTDKADLIASYYWKFKEALQPISQIDPGPPEGPQMPNPDENEKEVVTDVICVDLSAYQSGFDFQKYVNAGGIGVILKATEGASIQDACYKIFRQEALDAGLTVASYHFMRSSNPETQADYYLDFAQPEDGERVICDYEDDSVPLENVKVFFQRIQLRNPTLQLTLYSGHTIKDKLGNNSDAYLAANTSLWLAQYTTGTPSWPKTTWPNWSLWQYSDKGTVPGFNGNVDINRFNGSDENFIAWMGPVGDIPQPIPPENLTPTVSVMISSDTPVNLIINTDLNVTVLP